ncbi:hypothetical protein B0T16DRAFT_455869 [Cercophora newfieldiana]|uniref:Uncharacterized protein n=1 Tax=Cercophora newfieldiana TaxID=92897 RepID=A0AA39Y984_9PEZI|nr:hypothetical protein B0T16DRAFT_455869 [Cercophora newfieldiana]
MPPIRTAKNTGRTAKAAAARTDNDNDQKKIERRNRRITQKLDQELTELSFIEGDLKGFCQTESEIFSLGRAFGKDCEELEEDIKTLESHVEDLTKRSDRINKYIAKNKLIDGSGSEMESLAKEAKDEVWVLLTMARPMIQTFRGALVAARKFDEMEAEFMLDSEFQDGDEEGLADQSEVEEVRGA